MGSRQAHAFTITVREATAADNDVRVGVMTLRGPSPSLDSRLGQPELALM